MRSSRIALLGGVLAVLTIFAAQPMQAQRRETQVVITADVCMSNVYSSSGICIDNPTPQQRAEQQERERKERERLERERLEREAKQAAFQRKVDAQLAKMGGNPARRAEAERFVAMQEQAEAARAKLPRPKVCTPRTWDQQTSFPGSTRDVAFAALTTSVSRRQGCSIGGSETVTSVRLASAANCSERKLPTIKPPPVGTCLGCISEKQAIPLGYVPGQGWPPPPTEWVCTATVACASQKCEGPGSKVSAQ